jgi:Flp pilus assembly protein TadG
MARPTTTRARRRSDAGQTLVEMAFVLPVALVVSLGMIDVSYALLHQHVISRISREGANLISRDVTLLDASNAIKSMTTPPVDFTNGSQLVLSVLKKGSTVGTANYDKVVLYQRYAIGTLGTPSTLSTAGPAPVGPAPNFLTSNSDTDVNLRISNLPANVDMTRGGLLYVTEVFTQHAPLTPLDKFGVSMPATLRSIAYF